jgi:Conserved TM helix
MNITTPITTWGDAVFVSLTNALNNFLAAIPLIIGALLILLIGWVLSNIAARLVTRLLRGAGIDRLYAEHGQAVYPEGAMRYTPSVVVGEVVRWLIRIVFLIAAANALNLPQVSQLLNQILLWIPNLIVAAIVLLVAPVLARFVRGAIEVSAGQMGFTNASLLGRIAQIAIIAFAVIIAVNQVGIAANLVDTLFIGIVAAVALAFGLAFGLGGRDVAAEVTRGWYDSTRETAQRVREKADQTARSAGSATTPASAPRREARVTSAASVRTSDTLPE